MPWTLVSTTPVNPGTTIPLGNIAVANQQWIVRVSSVAPDLIRNYGTAFAVYNETLGGVTQVTEFYERQLWFPCTWFVIGNSTVTGSMRFRASKSLGNPITVQSWRFTP